MTGQILTRLAREVGTGLEPGCGQSQSTAYSALVLTAPLSCLLGHSIWKTNAQVVTEVIVKSTV